MKRIGLISDTHGYIDERIIHHLKNCDEIWHAGDIGHLSVTNKLKPIAPLRVVYGNIDDSGIRQEFTLDQIFELEGLKIYITHIGGRPGKYNPRVREKIKEVEPDIFICGHSHICMVQRLPTGMIHLNPGAAGVHGFHKTRTLMRFTLEKSKIENLEIVELGKRGLANPVE